MSERPLPEGVSSAFIDTPRLRMHVLTAGPHDAEPVILVHGNCSAARFFEELMLALAPRYRVIVPDLRGYGRTEPKPIDATRGVQNWSNDLRGLIEALDLHMPHLLGWSMGGQVVMQYAIGYSDDVASITLLAGASPYGFGGTCDVNGLLTSPDFAGSGGGVANPEFIERLRAGDRSDDSPSSPRNVLNTFYFKPPFRSPREDILVDEMLSTVCGPENYPGDAMTVESWPGVAPGKSGVLNAISPKYLNLSSFATINPRVPVLWIRGDSDQIVSDTSLFDMAFLGQIGAVPGWPGQDACPPQPMIRQLRAVLDAYAARGGRYQEVVLRNCGHTPHIEQPEEFSRAFLHLLDEAGRQQNNHEA